MEMTFIDQRPESGKVIRESRWAPVRAALMEQPNRWGLILVTTDKKEAKLAAMALRNYTTKQFKSAVRTMPNGNIEVWGSYTPNAVQYMQ